MSYRFDRAYYRLVYPIAFRPTFAVGTKVFPVVDLSEQGVRFLHSGHVMPPSGTKFAGKLSLPTGETIEIAGTVVRVEPPHVALSLTRGVPFGLMLDQQRFLQKRLVTWR